MATAKANTENKEIVTRAYQKVLKSVTIELSPEEVIKLKALIGDTSGVLPELYVELNKITGSGPYDLIEIRPSGVIVLADDSDEIIKEKLKEIGANLNF